MYSALHVDTKHEYIRHRHFSITQRPECAHVPHTHALASCMLSFSLHSLGSRSFCTRSLSVKLSAHARSAAHTLGSHARLTLALPTHARLTRSAHARRAHTRSAHNRCSRTLRSRTLRGSLTLGPSSLCSRSLCPQSQPAIARPVITRPVIASLLVAGAAGLLLASCSLAARAGALTTVLAVPASAAPGPCSTHVETCGHAGMDGKSNR
jgi:hypothetical protein